MQERFVSEAPAFPPMWQTSQNKDKIKRGKNYEKTACAAFGSSTVPEPYGGKNDASVSSDTPANIVVDGKEISAKDFLIEHLSAYIQSEVSRSFFAQKRGEGLLPLLCIRLLLQITCRNIS